MVIRPADDDDVRALDELDLASRSPISSPNPEGPRHPDRFRDDVPNLIVAEVAGVLQGMVLLGRPTGLVSNRHVWSIQGLDVHPRARSHGLGRRLLAAAMDEARARGATRLTLRVLAHNDVARALYRSAGFVVEGVLAGEFILDGESVDDVLMARRLDEGMVDDGIEEGTSLRL